VNKQPLQLTVTAVINYPNVFSVYALLKYNMSAELNTC